MPAMALIQDNPAIAHVASPDRDVRVLYAEDQTTSRIVTKALLQRLGYSVDAVEDGEQALAKAMTSHYDIILLDIEMPVMDGASAAKRIRSDAKLCRDVPIVALSAFLADSTETCEWRKHFDWTLSKPATGPELKRAVSRALNVIEKAAVPQEFVDSLRTTLPKSMWQRLVNQAGDEMHALALTASACCEAVDTEQLGKCARALVSLARNFGAFKVAGAAEALLVSHQRGDAMRLCGEIATWRLQARDLEATPN
jgi:CheY-like chemotaxis protein